MESVAPILFLSSHIGVGDFRRLSVCSRSLRSSILSDSLCWSVAGNLAGERGGENLVTSYEQYDSLRAARKCCRECGRADASACFLSTSRNPTDRTTVHICEQCMLQPGGYSQRVTREDIQAASFEIAMSGCMVRKLKSVMRNLSECLYGGENAENAENTGSMYYWRSQVEEHLVDGANKMLASNLLSIRGHRKYHQTRR